MAGTPTFIRDGCLDILASNSLGQRLDSVAFVGTELPVNLALFCFLDEGAHQLYPDW